MAKFVKFSLLFTLFCAAILIIFWQKSERRAADHQTRYTELIKEIKPFLARKNRPDKTRYGSIIDSLENPENAARQQTENTAVSGIITAPTPKLTTGFENYLAAINSFEIRFADIAPQSLSYCQRDELYRYWGAMRHWKYWAERTKFIQNAEHTARSNAVTPPPPDLPPNDLSKRRYEAAALEYMGVPLPFEAIKMRGEAEFAAVSAELAALAAQIKTQHNESLDEYAARPQHLSHTDAELKPRLEAALRRMEAAFKNDFAFAPVPAAEVEARTGYGPRFAIASYNRHKNAMIVYWQTGVYTHVYDAMLAVHEIMPGHHQQLTMSREQLCTIGPISTTPAFLEGWASYAEILAEAKGLFAAPDQRLGWLDYRLIRAMRILLDAARIEDSVSEDDAKALWERRMPARLHPLFAREWSRINGSSQHLTYILGSDAILTAKTHVKSELGASYDEAEFHHAILNSQHRSLEFLGPRMSAQIRERRRLKAAEETQVKAEVKTRAETRP